MKIKVFFFPPQSHRPQSSQYRSATGGDGVTINPSLSSMSHFFNLMGLLLKDEEISLLSVPTHLYSGKRLSTTMWPAYPVKGLAI